MVVPVAIGSQRTDKLPLLGFLLSFAATGLLASLSLAGSSNSSLDISADGHLLACSNRDSGTITVVALSSSLL